LPRNRRKYGTKERKARTTEEKMVVVLFKKKIAFKGRKKPGTVLPFLKNVGCT